MKTFCTFINCFQKWATTSFQRTEVYFNTTLLYSPKGLESHSCTSVPLSPLRIKLVELIIEFKIWPGTARSMWCDGVTVMGGGAGMEAQTAVTQVNTVYDTVE